MFGFANLLTLAVFAAAGALILAQQLQAEQVDPIDADINRVEVSLGEVETLLQQIQQDSGESKQFAELGKHVQLIREQLATIQEEYHLNQNIDQFKDRIGNWHESFEHVGERLRRDLEAFHKGEGDKK